MKPNENMTWEELVETVKSIYDIKIIKLPQGGNYIRLVASARNL